VDLRDADPLLLVHRQGHERLRRERRREDADRGRRRGGRRLPPRELERRLGERGYEVRGAADPAKRRLAVPAHLTADVLAAKPVRLEYRGNSDGLDGDYDAFRVRRAAYTVLADLVAISATKESPSAATSRPSRGRRARSRSGRRRRAAA
jgi:hypothetical protein